jgi:hypothetical protein
MATIQKMKTCDGKDTNIFTGLFYNIRNQNYGDVYGNQNYLNYQNPKDSEMSLYQVKISQMSGGTSFNWYFQQIGDCNYYSILNQNYGNGNGNANYLDYQDQLDDFFDGYHVKISQISRSQSI